MSITEETAARDANPPAAAAEETKRRPARRAATPAPPGRAERRRVPTALLVVGCLVVGGALGAAVMRQRYRARDVVVAVNGVIIDRDAFMRRLEMAAGPQVLRQMVGEELQVQFAKAKGAAPTDTEVAKRFADLSTQPGFKEQLARSGRSPEEARRAVLVSMCEAAVFTRGVSVTDAEVRAFYRQNTDKTNPKARYYRPAVAQIAVIVTPTQAEAEKARAAMDRGMPFREAARAYSRDRSRANGGVVAPVLQGRMRSAKAPGLEEAIFSMNIGQRIGPRQFGNLWWIIRCLDRKPAETAPFERVADECRSAAMLAKGLPGSSKQVQAEFEKFQKGANIQTFWKQYKAIVSAE